MHTRAHTHAQHPPAAARAGHPLTEDGEADTRGLEGICHHAQLDGTHNGNDLGGGVPAPAGGSVGPVSTVPSQSCVLRGACQHGAFTIICVLRATRVHACVQQAY